MPDTLSPLAALLRRIDKKLDDSGMTERAASLEVTGKPDFIRDLRRPRRKRMPDAEALSRLAEILGTSVEWLLGDAPPPNQGPLVRSELAGASVSEITIPYGGPDRTRKIPLLGSAMGGEYGNINEHIELTELHLGEILEWVSADPVANDDADAYALRVLGDSMVPAFEPGVMVKISPRIPVSIGDNVVVQLREETEDGDRVTMVLIKKLVKRTSSYVELEQYNPRVTFRVPRAQLALDARGNPRIHKVTSSHYR